MRNNRLIIKFRKRAHSMKCASFERASEIAASAGYGAVREATYKKFLGFKYDVTPKYQKGKIIAAK